MLSREGFREYASGALWVWPSIASIAALITGSVMGQIIISPRSPLAPLAVSPDAISLEIFSAPVRKGEPQLAELWKLVDEHGKRLATPLFAVLIVANIPLPSTTPVTSVTTGEYTAPPAHGPAITEICGTTPERRTLRKKTSP